MFFLCIGPSKAQLSMSVVKNIPSSIVFIRQLVQIQLMNQGSARQVDMTVTLKQDGLDQIYFAEYHAITIKHGVQLINLGQTEAAIKEYGSTSVARTLRNTGRLDFGNYIVCVFVKDEQAGPIEDCLSFIVAPLTPPILVQPSNESEVVTSTPLLTWLPPTPTLPGIVYSLRLTAMDSGQTAIDALSRNPVLYSADNLPVNIQVYPSTAPPLEKTKKYAWQVEAFKDQSSLGITEVWEFRFKQPALDKKIVATSFYRVKKNQDGTYCMARPVLQLLIPDVKSPQETNFKLSDAEGNPVRLYKRSTSRLNLKAGDNFLTLDLYTLAKLEDGKFYFMKIRSDQSDYNISFQYFQK